MLTHQTRFFAHRGLHGSPSVCPENSLPAFRRAVEAGFGIELDVRLSRDGQAVVFHDARLRRVCGVNRLVSDCTLRELQTQTLYDSPEHIPLLSEVLSLVDGAVPLILEIKSSHFDRNLCEAVAGLLDPYRGEISIESFHPGVLLWFLLNRPAVRRGQLCSGSSRMKRGSSRLGAFLLQTQITNFLTKPDFIACNVRLPRTPAFYFWRRRAGTVGWTLRSAQAIRDCRSDFDAFIFERVFSSD